MVDGDEIAGHVFESRRTCGNPRKRNSRGVGTQVQDYLREQSAYMLEENSFLLRKGENKLQT